MTKHALALSKDLTLPADAATQTFAFLGRKGSGKTYAAGKLVELLLQAQTQVVILDTVGNWYGLRLSADGKKRAFDIPVIGGLRGDVPLEAEGGALIADTLMDTGRSAIVDISQFSKAARQRFATAFGERLWQRKKADHHPVPLTLVIEEAQLIVPQAVAGDTARMVGIYEEIIRLGRNYGIGVVMISQRPQSVNKEVLNQTECLCVFQTSGAQERDALKKWIVDQGGSVDLIKELPSLPIGTGYLWSPQWLQVFKRITIAPKTTYDSTATPKPGQKRATAKLAPLDLDDLATRMKEVVERAKQDDPKALRKRIAELERDAEQRRLVSEKWAQREHELLLKLDKKKPGKPVEIKAPVLDPKARAMLDTLVKAGRQASTQLEALQKRVLAAATQPPHDPRQLSIEQLAGAVISPPPRHGKRIAMQAIANLQNARPITLADFEATAKAQTQSTTRAFFGIDHAAKDGNGHADAHVGDGERKILTAAAQNPDGASREQLTLFTGYKRSTRDRYIQRLRQKDLVLEQGGQIVASPAGVAWLGDDYVPLPRGAALLHHWMGRLPEGERAVLQVVVHHHPQAVPRDEISEATGYKRSTRDRYLQRLALRKLVSNADRDGIVASKELF
jgi:hypothetical protein